MSRMRRYRIAPSLLSADFARLGEELGFACPHPVGAPVMVTCSTTVGMSSGHVDVSLWYVVHANREQSLAHDAGEFAAVRWFAFDGIPFERSDPNLRRFVAKLRATEPSGRTPT